MSVSTSPAVFDIIISSVRHIIGITGLTLSPVFIFYSVSEEEVVVEEEAEVVVEEEAVDEVVDGKRQKCLCSLLGDMVFNFTLANNVSPSSFYNLRLMYVYFFCSGGGRGAGRGGRGGRGGGRGGGGMKGGAKVIVEPHRHEGIFVARGKEDALVTLNSTPGVAVYGEKRISVEKPSDTPGGVAEKIEYRVWNPFRSKCKRSWGKIECSS
jgi:hypothetical protein